MFALRFPDRAPLRRTVTTATAGLLLVLAGCGGHEDSRSSATPSGQPSKEPSGQPSSSPTGPSWSGTLPSRAADVRPARVPQAEAARARTATRDYLAALDAVLAHPATAKGRAGGAVAGAALAQLRNQAAGLQASGEHAEGRSRITRAVVVRRTTSPASMTVAACVDSSGLHVIDASGKKVSTGTSAKRSLNYFRLERRGDRWVVVDQSFPDDPDC